MKHNKGCFMLICFFILFILKNWTEFLDYQRKGKDEERNKGKYKYKDKLWQSRKPKKEKERLTEREKKTDESWS